MSPAMSKRALQCLVAGAGLAAALAHADGGAKLAQPLLPRYVQECAACHVAYPPALLPAQSWDRILRGLQKHYGTDASLDARGVEELRTWLLAREPGKRKYAEEPPEDRITRAAWFVREHREITPTTWKLPAVRTAANCAACHPRADQGDFNEHAVRIPR